jgi:drug/metabolite transporter (DMT)-like permease
MDDAPSAAGHPDETYHVVRRAVEDALWNVLGTVVYALVLVFLLFVGLQFIAVAAVGPLTESGTLVVFLIGGVLVLVGVVELVRTFDLFPSIRGR